MKQAEHYILVDDDPTSNLICEFNIRRWNKRASIDIFKDPEKALGVIRNGTTEKRGRCLLFLDLNMPGMGGWEFLEVFGSLPENIRKRYGIFIHTASLEEVSAEIKSFPFVLGVVSKPLSYGSLEGIFNNLQNLEDFREEPETSVREKERN